MIGISINAYSMQSHNTNPFFYGKVLNGKSKADSIQVAYFKHCLLGTNDLSFFVVKINNKGEFNFKLPISAEPMLMQICFYSSGKLRMLEDYYYVEPNDSIRLEIFAKDLKDSVNFYGKSSMKYNIIAKLLEQNDRFLIQKRTMGFNSYTDSAELNSKLLRFVEIVKRFSKETKVLLSSHEEELSPTIKKLLYYQYGNYTSRWHTLMNALYTQENGKKSIFTNVIRKHIQLYADELRAKYHDVIYLAPRYLLDLLYDYRLNLLVKGHADKVDMHAFYNYVKNQHSGVVRERLLFDFFSSRNLLGKTNYSQQVYDSLVIDADQLIKTPYLSLIFNNKLKLKGGTKLFDSQFTDLNDSSFNTRSLLGKVFILDVWGEGCTGCVQFHKMFEKGIYPLIKDNPKFAYLSINIDAKKETWLNGIKSGNYTSENYLNVFTGGVRINHPFLKYYNVNSIPFALLVDQHGRILSNLTAAFQGKQDIYESIISGLKE